MFQHLAKRVFDATGRRSPTPVTNSKLDKAWGNVTPVGQTLPQVEQPTTHSIAAAGTATPPWIS